MKKIVRQIRLGDSATLSSWTSSIWKTPRPRKGLTALQQSLEQDKAP